MSILEEFYYGNIDPNTQSFDRNSGAYQAMQILSDREEKLCAVLEGKETQLFLDYVNAWSEVNGTTCLAKFITGFKLGAQFTAEASKEDWNRGI